MDHISYLILFTAAIWLKYCRNGVKHYTINQSINQYFDLYWIGIGIFLSVLVQNKKIYILSILPIHFNYFFKYVSGIFLLYKEKVLGCCIPWLKIINNLTHANQNIHFFSNIKMKLICFGVCYLKIFLFYIYYSIGYKSFARKKCLRKHIYKIYTKNNKSQHYIFNGNIMLRMRQTNDQIKNNAMAFHLKFNISQIIISLSERVDSRTQVNGNIP